MEVPDERREGGGGVDEVELEPEPEPELRLSSNREVWGRVNKRGGSIGKDHRTPS